MFFCEVLFNDLSVMNFIDFDFFVINECLVRYYDIEGVMGEEFCCVFVLVELLCGGLFGMVGVY